MVSINRYKWNHLMTHCFGGLVGLDCLERIVAKLREEFLFEVILGIHFPSANWRAGSYQIKASREDWHHDKSLQQVSWFCLWAMAVLVLISTWNGTIHHEKICLLTFVTGVPLWSEFDQVHGGDSRKTCARVVIYRYENGKFQFGCNTHTTWYLLGGL